MWPSAPSYPLVARACHAPVRNSFFAWIMKIERRGCAVDTPSPMIWDLLTAGFSEEGYCGMMCEYREVRCSQLNCFLVLSSRFTTLSAVVHPTGQRDSKGVSRGSRGVHSSTVVGRVGCTPLSWPGEAGLFALASIGSGAGINRVRSSLCVPRLDAGPVIRSSVSEFCRTWFYRSSSTTETEIGREYHLEYRSTLRQNLHVEIRSYTDTLVRSLL